MPRTKKTEKYNYLIEYVREAAEARLPLRALCERAIMAYKQHPYKNSYRENAYRYQQSIAGTGTKEQLQAVKQICDSIPDSTNDTVFNAVETFTSMTMGGASQFEYQPADEYLSKDTELVDRLAALAQFFHDDNKIDSLLSQATRNMALQGQACFFLNPVEDGRFRVALIDAWRKLDDPEYTRTNRKRYEGYTEITHWSTLKKHIYKQGRNYFLSVMNDVDQYIDAINGSGNYKWENEVSADLDLFRGIYGSTTKTSESVDDDGKPTSPDKPGYKGDDIEVAYIWDTISDVYGIVVNRRFLVLAEEHPYRRTLQVGYRRTDGNDGSRDITVEIDSPMVTIPFIQTANESYPVSPLFYCLDDFDAICSMESVMDHDISIMAPVTFLATSYDAEQLSMASQLAGQIVEGTMNSMQVMNKSHDMSAIISGIERREQRIKRMMGATDQFDLAQMIGNRASASEASAMTGAISQRMNSPLANIETGMSELVQKMFAMYIIYSDEDEITFPNNGATTTVSKTDMLGRSVIRAKLKTQIKTEQQEQSRNAIVLLQTLINTNGVNTERLVSTLVPVISQGTINRRQAQSLVEQEQLNPELVQQILAALPQQETPALDQAALSGLSATDIEQMSQAAANAIAGPAQAAQQALDQNAYAMAPNATPVMNGFTAPIEDTGYDNYTAGRIADQPNQPISL